MKVPVNGTRQCDRESGIATGIKKARRTLIRETGMVQNRINVQCHTRAIKCIGNGFQTGLGAIQRSMIRRSQIKTVIDVITYRLVT